MMDKDVFLDEAILAEEEAALLLLDRDEALASRLSRWKRPALPVDHASGCSRRVGTVLIPFAYDTMRDSIAPSCTVGLVGLPREASTIDICLHSVPGILERGIAIEVLGSKSFLTYESNILFALRFMIDFIIVGGNWIEVPAGKYRKAARIMSYRQLELDCLYSDLVSHPAEGEHSKMAPFRILSFDIECAGCKGHFPEPTHDPVIQIANLVTLQGEGQPFVRNFMTLKSCSPIVGVDVMSFVTERDISLAWRDFIREVDPDIIIGYNICKFDLPYLIERAEVLKIAVLPILGRIRNSHVHVRDTTFASRQYGVRDSKDVAVEGRVQFDLLQDYKLSSYSLNSVSAHFLGEQKEDVHHSIISDFQNGSSETRRRLAVYCLKDAYLPQRLLDKLMYIYNYVEMARVIGVPISFLLSRGQSIKLLRKAKQKNLIIPNIKGQGSGQDSFEGATVLEARAGYYEEPIATLDFASLYPSIMMAYNLCYCTLVPLEDACKLNMPPESLNKTPSGETFVKPEVRKGILPEILEELLAARKRAKADLKPIKMEFEKVYFSYLLISKERYAGLHWTNPEKLDKMDTKVQYIKNTISDLLMNRVDLSLLVITKGLTKMGEDYAVKAGHVELAERMPKARWKREWTDPHHLLRRKLIVLPEDADGFFYSIDLATMVLEKSCFLHTQADKLRRKYGNRCRAVKQSSITSETKVKQKAHQQIRRLSDEWPPDVDSDHLFSTNQFYELWFKSHGSVLIDDKVVTDVISFYSFGLSAFSSCEDKEKTQVFVKHLHGTLSVQIDLRKDVDALRREVEKRLNLSGHYYTYGLNVLEGHTLLSYGITRDAQIHMHFRLRGGVRFCCASATISGFNINGSVVTVGLIACSAIDFPVDQSIGTQDSMKRRRSEDDLSARATKRRRHSF
uniref:DNA polymerase delta catalytic subunit n=1 Tax=Leersia perrieri TaxID=77586 RepID=A0A0D9XPV9_9ORYZ